MKRKTRRKITMCVKVNKVKMDCICSKCQKNCSAKSICNHFQQSHIDVIVNLLKQKPSEVTSKLLKKILSIKCQNSELIIDFCSELTISILMFHLVHFDLKHLLIKCNTLSDGIKHYNLYKNSDKSKRGSNIWRNRKKHKCLGIVAEDQKENTTSKISELKKIRLKVKEDSAPSKKLHLPNEKDCKETRFLIAEHKKHDGKGDIVPTSTPTSSLWQDLFGRKKFWIRPPTVPLQVFMQPSALWHPNKVGDIPWSWLNEEKWRLHTFVNYPHNTAKSAILLASEGFLYIGRGSGSDDKVICFFCLHTKQGWQDEDNIVEVHKQLASNCPMVTKDVCNNIPLASPGNGSTLFDQIGKKDTPYNLNNHILVGTNASQSGNDVQTDGTGLSHPPRPIQWAERSVGEIANPVPQRNASDSLSTSHQATNNTVSSGSATIITSNSGQENNGSQGNTSTPSAGSGSTPPQSNTGASIPSQPAPVVSSAPSQSPATAEPATPEPETPSPPPPSVAVTTASLPPTTTAVPASSTAPAPAVTHLSHSSGSTPSTTTSSAPPSRSGPPTYQQLGIITERPKRFEFAVKAKRLETYTNWPRDHHLTPENLATSGFYYAGYGDCARCFYCGGGLRNWEDDDDVRVEHARWFPKCAFIRQQMGQDFVDCVQHLNRDHDVISMAMVARELGKPETFYDQEPQICLKKDPAVKTVVGMGYDEKDVLSVANTLKETGTLLSADELYKALVLKHCPARNAQVAHVSVSTNVDPAKDEETLKTLKEQNSQLRQQTVCKICMDREVTVVFLPCGHLVCCADCAVAMKACPVCRKEVKGVVRAKIS